MNINICQEVDMMLSICAESSFLMISICFTFFRCALFLNISINSLLTCTCTLLRLALEWVSERGSIGVLIDSNDCC